MGLLKTKIKITAAVIIIIAAVAGGLYFGSLVSTKMDG